MSFTERRAHFYKLVPGGGMPQEIVLDGPYTYTNANVEAALNDSSVKPWTKLDTRRAPGRSSARSPTSSRTSAQSPISRTASLARSGRQRHVGERRSALPRRSSIRRRSSRGACRPSALRCEPRSRNDYLAKPFPADFWLDDAGRVRRVLVNYRTPGGGADRRRRAASRTSARKVDLTLPAASRIQDITP